MTESKLLKRIKFAAKERKQRQIESEQSKNLKSDETEWFLNEKRRPHFEEQKLIKVLGQGYEQQQFDIENTWAEKNGKPKADWFVKVLPPVFIEPLPLYVYRHLRRKHRGATANPEFEAEFWDLVQPWVDDRSVADNIIGGLELEKELLPSWSPGTGPFANIATRKVTPQMIHQTVVQAVPMPLPTGILDFLDFSYGGSHGQGKAKASFDGLPGQPGASHVEDDVPAQLQGDLRDEAGRSGVVDLEQVSADTSECESGSDPDA